MFQEGEKMGKKKHQEAVRAYIWSAPSLALILLIVIFPILYTGYISLTNKNVYHWNNYEIIGLKKYKEILMCFANFVIFYNFFGLLLLTDNNFGVILLLWHWTLRQFCCKIYVAAYAPAQAAAGQFSNVTIKIFI